MRAKQSQRHQVFLLIGFLALVVLSNLVIFALAAKAQLAAGGLFMIALGGLWIYLVGGPETLTCDHDTCRIVKPRFLLRGKSVDAMPLSSIAKVCVEEIYLMSHDGPGRTGYQVVLRGRDKPRTLFRWRILSKERRLSQTESRHI